MDQGVTVARFVALCCWTMATLMVCCTSGHLDKTDAQLINVLRRIIEARERNSESSAKLWLKEYNEGLRKAQHKVALAEYEYSTDLTPENAQKYTEISVATDEWMKKQTKIAKQYLNGKTKEDFENKSVYRMLKLITCSSAISNEESVNKEISELINKLSNIYSTTLIDGKSLDDVEVLMATASYEDRLRYWVDWRNAVGPQMKPLYTQLIENLNSAARDNGFSDIGEPWRYGDFGYETENLEQMAVDLFEEVKPLYQQLHAYVRRILYNKYPEANIDLRGAIPAHILGNMWAQQWILEGFSPYPEEPEVDITPVLQEKFSVKDMFKMAEGFFTSVGLEEMTETFWNKSMLTRPAGKEVVCHGSATDLFTPGDYRIKMCTKRNQDDFGTIHHEMGHIEYFMEYSEQPAIFRNGANAAFHEAIGDTIGISVNTATHFQAINLLGDFEWNDKSDINFLLQRAFEKVAFLPFGYLIDLYRWEVFRGNINESNYNSKWWELRKKIQGVVPPVERPDNFFDPGAKYHIPANVPYIRYFFAFIAEFQFYEAMCKESGHVGPIHRCDFYQSKEAGTLLKTMMKLGQSEEWQVAMEKVTGIREFSAKPLINYFEPLHQWLIAENRRNNEFIGWE